MSLKESNPPESISEEMRFLSEHAEELRVFKGEWIAIAGSEVIAHGKDLSKTMEQSKEKGFESPFVTAIPEEPLGHLHV